MMGCAQTGQPWPLEVTLCTWAFLSGDFGSRMLPLVFPFASQALGLVLPAMALGGLEGCWGLRGPECPSPPRGDESGDTAAIWDPTKGSMKMRGGAALGLLAAAREQFRRFVPGPAADKTFLAAGDSAPFSSRLVLAFVP